MLMSEAKVGHEARTPRASRTVVGVRISNAGRLLWAPLSESLPAALCPWRRGKQEPRVVGGSRLTQRVLFVQVSETTVDVRRFITGYTLSREDHNLANQEALEFILRVHNADADGELKEEEFYDAVAHVLSWTDRSEVREDAKGVAGRLW